MEICKELRYNFDVGSIQQIEIFDMIYFEILFRKRR